MHLTFDQHVTSVSGQCFYQLRQLRLVRQSLYIESTTTLIRASVSSRVDYCCSLLIGSPRSVTDKLQRVLNAAARVITNTKKYESGLSRILRHDLHLFLADRTNGRAIATLLCLSSSSAVCRRL